MTGEQSDRTVDHPVPPVPPSGTAPGNQPGEHDRDATERPISWSPCNQRAYVQGAEPHSDPRQSMAHRRLRETGLCAICGTAWPCDVWTSYEPGPAPAG